MAKKNVMHVICGTHWDREWRHTAEQSKLRLADLIDSLIDILERKPSYKSFCLDGGTVILEDYLTVRPENEARLKKLINEKRILLVGWYTLPETFTVAPEALIRNIMLGQRQAAAFGGYMKSGYTAFSYGQLSQLPQIYQGFGIKTAVMYRGLNKHAVPSFFVWEGKDGSRLHVQKCFDEVTRTNWFFYLHQPLVLGKRVKDLDYRFARKNIPVHPCDEILYERAVALQHEDFSFPQDEASQKKALDLLLRQALPYAVGRNILALDLEDNARPYEMLPDVIAALNRVSPDIEIKQTSLDDYLDTVIAESRDEDLYVHKGEMRFTAVEVGFNGLLGNTHSSRTRLKVLNEDVETILMHYAEPLASFASFFGFEYPKTNLDMAWRFLLQNHAHDSICGAAVDQAHEDMLFRFSNAKTASQEVAARSITALFNNINSEKDFQDKDYTVTIFNMFDVPRKEVLPLMIDLPRVSALAQTSDFPPDACGQDGELQFFDIVDADGNSVEYELLSSEPIRIGVESELDSPGVKMDAIRKRLLVYVKVPRTGYATYAVRPRPRRYIPRPEHGPARALIAREHGVLENEFLRVTLNSNGTFNLTDKQAGRPFENMHCFIDKGHTGGAHSPREPQRNPTHTSLGCPATITMLESNQLRGVFRIDVTLSIPAAATLDNRDRLRELVPLPISTWLTLEKGSRILKLRTRLTNRARDHKLSVLFPTAINADLVSVESAFAVETRCIRHQVTGDNDERFFPFQPMQNFIDLSDGRYGLAILNKGLREYEVMDDPLRTIAITLLRTQRDYMTANPMMTPDEFDKYTGLHSFGDIECRYALYPHAGNWETGEVMKHAYLHKINLLAIQGVPRGGQLPGAASLLSVDPADKIMISALKLAEDRKGVILRIWNTSGQAQEAAIMTALPIKSAVKTTFDETFIDDLKIKNGRCNLQLGPHKIQTIRLQQ